MPEILHKCVTDLQDSYRSIIDSEEFRKEAYAYCMGQIICSARKKEKMTQSELAEKIGTNKSYISRIENGTVDPSISTFCRIIDALGLKIDIVKPIL